MRRARIDRREPALDAAVQRRGVVDEEEVTGEKRLGRIVEDGQIIVGMRNRPGAGAGSPVAEMSVSSSSTSSVGSTILTSAASAVPMRSRFASI